MATTVNIKGLVFEEFISVEQIRQKVKAIADQINADYAGKSVILIGVLNGAAPFIADLARQVHVDAEIDFLRVSSYSGLGSTGDAKITMRLKNIIKGRHIIIVEDILESGLTLLQTENTLRKQEPASVQFCVFCRKPASAKYDIKPKYVGLDLGPEFIVGYGLDYDEKGRNLKSIYKRIEAAEP